MGLLISQSVREKLQAKHGVTEAEIIEAFGNRDRVFLEDTRTENKTNPPTMWFMSETDMGRRMKVVFIDDGTDMHIKTAFSPTDNSEKYYRKHAKYI